MTDRVNEMPLYSHLPACEDYVERKKKTPLITMMMMMMMMMMMVVGINLKSLYDLIRFEPVKFFRSVW